ncbi:MAG: MerR family transcriptional regulator [Candidatus Schekmanbacteria bacterium]|nr:MerR family transcriptional regulator [Candidatus Schekmanbacteria bacterium]
MDSEAPPSYSIGELAEHAGVSRRAVRFYVQRGLIGPPVNRGRGSYYTEDHLAAINRIRSLQRGGLTLDQVREHFGEDAAGSRSAPPHGELVLRIELQPHVVLEVRADRLPDSGTVMKLRGACCRILAGENPDTEHDAFAKEGEAESHE